MDAITKNDKLLTLTWRGCKRMKAIKDKVAQEKGYPSWEEMFNWICRENERPEVVGQLIESAMVDYVAAVSKHLQDQSFEGWTWDVMQGYLTACITFENEIE
jgi:hypothetical protein